MTYQQKKWFYLIVLSLIWGTSYILIKKALIGFSAFQLGVVRILMAGLFLVIIGHRTIPTLPKNKLGWLALSGYLGSFFPMFLFAFAETEIDSSVAAVLNSLVPLFTLGIGLVVFHINFLKSQLLGVLLGLMGAVLLIFYGAELNPNQDYRYSLFVIIAALGYAANANIIKTQLSEVSPMGIAVGNFLSIMPVALLLLPFSGVTTAGIYEGSFFWNSMGYLAILSLFGTCVAKVMFNKLIQISSPLFSVSVTYLIPVVGIVWGLLDGEKFGLSQLAGALIILLGVYLVNKKPPRK